MKLFLLISLLTIGLAKAQSRCPPTGITAIAYPGSCQRFIRCINGVEIIQECAPGLAFDIVLGQCNAAGNANCNPCQGNRDDDVFFIRDETDCTRYTLCVGRVRSENQCRNGFYFNPVSNTCDRPENVDCPVSDTTTTTQPPGGSTTTPPPPDTGDDATCDLNTNFDMIASPTSCQRYTICTCGHPNIRQCPTGLIYDVVAQTCNTPAQGRCLTESAPTCPAGTVEQIAHPYDCRYYVLCIYGTPVFEACAPGLEMNRKTNKCDFPHIAQCTTSSSLTYSQLMSGMAFM